ncbi:hypothetical protein [Acinetobacter rathckeae]|uniref:hypothetical protein n=1 Tax=Acinetobacter rathckeae TaxID=2605272 RepID=UPI0018A2AC04|nr:hypothetical protein [Acinetobacter rathckeae]MBF7687489.1 hypothetical protein [Acinetobacter rathckeae]
MTSHTQKHPLIEQLIEQHIAFIEQQLLDTKYLQQESALLCDWLENKSLADFVSLEQVQLFFGDLLIHRDIPHNTLTQVGMHLSQALTHPINQNTTIAQVINPLHVDALAQYTASKTTQRQYFIAQMTKHPAFAHISTQLIQDVLNDYFQSHVTEKNGHVSRFMKIGKSMLENVTDLNLSQAIQQYLEKNVSKLAVLAEKLLNQQLSDDNVYQLHVQLWHERKNTPLSNVQHYIDPNDLTQTIPLLHQFWDHFRRSEFFAQQLQYNLEIWYAKQKHQGVLDLLDAIGTSKNQLVTQLQQHASSLLEKFIADGELKKRLQPQLQAFYYSPSTLELLQKL